MLSLVGFISIRRYRDIDRRMHVSHVHCSLVQTQFTETFTTWQQQRRCGRALWVAGSAITMSCPVNRCVQIVRFLSASVHGVWSKIHVCSP